MYFAPARIRRGNQLYAESGGASKTDTEQEAAPYRFALVRSAPIRSAQGSQALARLAPVRSASIMMTRSGWHRSNRNLRNLYPVRDYSHSRIIHGGVCVNAIDKPLKWAVGFFFASTDLSLELGSYI